MYIIPCKYCKEPQERVVYLKGAVCFPCKRRRAKEHYWEKDRYIGE
jgi:hypothetical protein